MREPHVPSNRIWFNRAGTAFSTGTDIPHYYGDTVRQIFVAIGVIVLIAVPLLLKSTTTQTPFFVGFALALFILAALTHPRSSMVMLANVVLAGLGIVFFETWAIAAFNNDATVVAFIFEAIVLALAIAFYYGLKTWRSMMAGLIGHTPMRDDFDEPIVPVKEDDVR